MRKGELERTEKERNGKNEKVSEDKCTNEKEL
jgi:hypothetical protein